MKVETCYPLVWPDGWARTPPRLRRRADRDEPPTTFLQALIRLQRELERLDADDVVISTSVETNAYGEPIGRRGNAEDPGAAVYFALGRQPRVLACDRWPRTADNLAAIARHIRALARSVERFGVGSLERAFAGFAGSPPSQPRARPTQSWRRVLGISDDEPVTVERIKASYRAMAKKVHPDQATGSHAAMAELNLARDEALRHLSH